MHFHVCDNDRKHTSGFIKDWLKRKRIQTKGGKARLLDFNILAVLSSSIEGLLANFFSDFNASESQCFGSNWNPACISLQDVEVQIFHFTPASLKFPSTMKYLDFDVS